MKRQGEMDKLKFQRLFSVIHPVVVLSNPSRVAEGLVPISSGHLARGNVHPEQGDIETRRKNNYVHALMSKENLKRPVDLRVMLLVFGKKQEYLERYR